MQYSRISKHEDIPRLRELWKLAFGDDGAYVDNFFQRYYRPERMLVLEQGGMIQAMTAWFDTELVLPGEERVCAAYLYAVATHPDARNRGLSSQLLQDADNYFRFLHCSAVTTVPAEPSLHRFFARNGFGEYFTHQEKIQTFSEETIKPLFQLQPVSAAQYVQLREKHLKGKAHIALPEDAVFYQQGICTLKEGAGLYQANAQQLGSVLLCAEGMDNGQLMLKEVLGEPHIVEQLLQELSVHLGQWSGVYREPGVGVQFGMMKWIDESKKEQFDWNQSAYLGLAFD